MGPKPASSSNLHQSDGVTSGHLDAKSVFLKQFDVVDNYSDHHYADKGVQKTSNGWAKKIQKEWKILEKDLPETIFVRVYEERIDLLRAVIIGPAGTPYHDGLFFFDFQFTSRYPSEPPRAHYHSAGLRLNPNLYACGTVCLSLLNTWAGKGCEKWKSEKSTMLQILVSIQGLVLNARPFFNEPAWSKEKANPSMENRSLEYNETTFTLSCKTMLYSLRRPPKGFEDFVAEHFCKHGDNILVACKAYLNGTQVGSIIGDTEIKVHEPGSQKNRTVSKKFKTALEKLVDELLNAFLDQGADCKKFLSQNEQSGDSKLILSQKDKAQDTSRTTVKVTKTNVKSADKIAQKAKAGETSHTNGTAMEENVEVEGADKKEIVVQKENAGDGSVSSSKAGKSKWKRCGQFLLKLGKKVLPIDH